MWIQIICTYMYVSLLHVHDSDSPVGLRFKRTHRGFREANSTSATRSLLLLLLLLLGISFRSCLAWNQLFELAVAAKEFD